MKRRKNETSNKIFRVAIPDKMPVRIIYPMNTLKTIISLSTIIFVLRLNMNVEKQIIEPQINAYNLDITIDSTKILKVQNIVVNNKKAVVNNITTALKEEITNCLLISKLDIRS